MLRARNQDARTRERVLRAVVERGPVTAPVLAEKFGLTPAGVRRHLDALEESGQIRLAPAPESRKGPGRPARSYVAGDLSRPTDPVGLNSAYDDVATQALCFLAEQVGPQAIMEFAQRRVAGLEERYGAVVDAAGSDVMARARALAQALADDGFAATARPIGNSADHPADGTSGEPGHAHITSTGLQLCQGYCPVQQVAARFPQFCEAETEAFSRLLGVHVQRLATLASGGHACTTYVPSRNGHIQDDHARPPRTGYPAESHDSTERSQR